MDVMILLRVLNTTKMTYARKVALQYMFSSSLASLAYFMQLISNNLLALMAFINFGFYLLMASVKSCIWV